MKGLHSFNVPIGLFEIQFLHILELRRLQKRNPRVEIHMYFCECDKLAVAIFRVENFMQHLSKICHHHHPIFDQSGLIKIHFHNSFSKKVIPIFTSVREGMIEKKVNVMFPDAIE